MPTIKILIALASAALIAGCGGEEDPVPPEQPKDACAEFDTPHEDITIGLTKTGGSDLVKVAIVSLDPATPAEGEENIWTVQLLDASDAPMPSAALTEVKPWMPEHGHGAQQPPVIGDTDADGQVEVSNIFFHMPGVWTMDFTVDDGGINDTATFGLCIGG
jgi:hypothetical protein